MSRFERFSYGAEFDFDESREDDDIKSRNHNRHTNESKKSGYLHDDDYTSKLNKKYTDCNARGKSYDYDKGQARYSISSESEGYEGFDKKPKSFKDSGPLQVKTDFMKNFKSRIGSKEEEDSESEEELASARALTLKTKLILSKLGWNANTISGNENKLVKNGDEEKKEMKDNKFYDPFSDDSSTKKPYHHRQEKQTVEERRVWASELPSVKTRDLEGQRDRKVGSKASLKKFLDSEDDCEATDFRITGETANSGVKDVDLIEMNIRECRSLIDSNKTDCEEVRNVKVQPRLENNKIKKRHCSDYMEKIQSESEDVQVVEPKRFKKSSKYPEEEEADYWKDDRSVFRTVDRRIRVKDRSPFKMKRYRSRSTSSFSGDSYSSYERRRSKHSYKKKHKRQDSRDSFGWRDKLRGQEERRGYKYEEKEKDTRSFDKWSPKLKKKSHSSDFKERVEAKSQVDVQLMKEEKPKKMTTHCDYFDEGSHWCERCNVIYEESVDYLKHLHSDSHQKSVRKDPKPWEDKSEEGGRVKSSRNKISVPLKGLEFMIGTSAFYCKLCSELIADVKLAEKHIKSESHNGNYRDFLQKNPKYAKLRTMDVESRLFQAVHVSHQEEIPESDYDVLPAMVKSEVKVEPIIEIASNKKIVTAKTEDNNVERAQMIEEEIKVCNEELVESNVSQECHQSKGFEEKPTVMSEDSLKEEMVRQEPIVMELKSKSDKVSLGLKSNIQINSTKSASSARDVANSISLSLKKLPFIGKRPSKMGTKNESEPGKSQTTIATNSASLSREELLSRVMKDTVIIQPKDIRITPFPGIPPEGMLGGYMSGYMMAPYMGYPHYGGYYDMNMYYDPSLYAATTSELQNSSACQASSNGLQVSNVETTSDMDLECSNINQDHYENYTIGCDSAPFDNTLTMEEVGGGQGPSSKGFAEEVESNVYHAENEPVVKANDNQNDSEACEATSVDASITSLD